MLVGAGVLSADTVGLKEIVGAAEGTIVVGPKEGDGVGDMVGANEGTIVVGPTEGDTVGDTVALSNVVGAPDGTIVVGPTEGNLLGCTVDLVGKADGDCDGVSVGVSVGRAIIQSASGETQVQPLSFHNPALSLLPRYMYTQ